MKKEYLNWQGIENESALLWPRVFEGIWRLQYAHYLLCSVCYNRKTTNAHSAATVVPKNHAGL